MRTWKGFPTSTQLLRNFEIFLALNSYKAHTASIARREIDTKNEIEAFQYRLCLIGTGPYGSVAQ